MDDEAIRVHCLAVTGVKGFLVLGGTVFVTFSGDFIYFAFPAGEWWQWWCWWCCGSGGGDGGEEKEEDDE